jgi:hypothetical protein
MCCHAVQSQVRLGLQMVVVSDTMQSTIELGASLAQSGNQQIGEIKQ